MSEINVKDLAVNTREAIRASGAAEYSLWMQYQRSLLPVVRWFRRHDHEVFSEELAHLYLANLAGRLEHGEIKRGTYNYLRRGAEKMLTVAGYQAPWCEIPKRGSRYKHNSYYETLLASFSESDNFHPNTLGDIVWVTRKFFSWLCENGHPDLTGVGADEIQAFMIECSNTMKSTSIHNVKLYLRKLCAYLYEHGLLPNSYEGLLGFRVSRTAKQFPTTSPEEIEAVLALIDRGTSKGKRDYAMFMLAIVTGLRAKDICRLKLTDIDWRKGEINILQTKTGENLQLPLTTDIGEALQDYILNGRQPSEDLQAYMGHASINETLYYVHLLPETLLAGGKWDTLLAEEVL
jgi:site-specific recombinase XerD